MSLCPQSGEQALPSKLCVSELIISEQVGLVPKAFGQNYGGDKMDKDYE